MFFSSKVFTVSFCLFQDEVNKRWPGILVSGEEAEQKLLFITDEDGKPLKDQPDNIMKMKATDAEERFYK